MDGAAYRAELAPFALAARRFLSALNSGSRTTLAELLVSLASLYTEGLRLAGMQLRMEEDTNLDDFEVVGERAQMQPRVQEVLRGLRNYWCYFNPGAASFGPDAGGGVGDLEDDLLDICGDLAPALRAYRSGDARLLGECHFAWRPPAGFWHWGHHATCAISALNAVVHPTV